MLGIAPRRRIDRLPLARPELMTSGMVEDTLLAHASGLRLLLGPADDREPPPVAAVAPLLQMLATQADRVLIDLGSVPTDFGRAAMQLAWEVWVVTSPDPVAAARAGTAIQAMEQAGVRPQKIGLLASQTSPEMTLGRAELEQATGRAVIFAVPAAPRACFEALRRGVPLVELAAELPTGQSLARIAATLAEQRSATLTQPVVQTEPAATAARS